MKNLKLKYFLPVVITIVFVIFFSQLLKKDVTKFERIISVSINVLNTGKRRVSVKISKKVLINNKITTKIRDFSKLFSNRYIIFACILK